MNKTDKLNIEKFISQLEDDSFQTSISAQTLINYPGDFIKTYLTTIIRDTRDLMAYGEYKIALENLLDNLLEEEITPTKDILLSLTDIQDDDIKRRLSFFDEAMQS